MRGLNILTAVILLQFTIFQKQIVNAGDVCTEVAKSIVVYVQNDRVGFAGENRFENIVNLKGEEAEKSVTFSAFRAIDRNIYRKIKMFVMGLVIDVGKSPNPKDDKLLSAVATLSKIKEIALDIIETFEATDVRRYLHAVREMVANPAEPKVDHILRKVLEICPATVNSGLAFSEEILIQAEGLNPAGHIVENTEASKLEALKSFVASALSVFKSTSNTKKKSLHDFEVRILRSYIRQELKWRLESDTREVFNASRDVLTKINEIKYRIERIGEEPTDEIISGVQAQYSKLTDRWETIFSQSKTDL